MYILTRFELRKLTAQKRSLVAIAAIVIMNLLFAVAFYLRNQRAGHKPVRGLEDRLVSEFMNAFVYTQTILAPCMFLLFPTILAIIGGHVLAGELELGSLRMTACRPVSRWQVVAAKFVALSAYAAVMLGVLLAFSYMVSALLFGARGDLLVVGPMFMLERGLYIHAADTAGARLLLSYLLAYPMLLSVAAMSMMFSMITRHFTTSAVLTACVYYCSYIVSGIPFLSAIHPFMPTRYLPFFRYALLPEIPWNTIAEHALWTGGFTVVFLGVAAALFSAAEL